MNVARPATAVLSTGSVSFPQVATMTMTMKMTMTTMVTVTITTQILQDRPVLALYQHPGQQGGKLAVVGSSAMLRFLFYVSISFNFDWLLRFLFYF